MAQYQLLPYQRTAGVLNELAGLAISPGPLQHAVRVAVARLEAARQSPRFAMHSSRRRWPMPMKPAGA